MGDSKCDGTIRDPGQKYRYALADSVLIVNPHGCTNNHNNLTHFSCIIPFEFKSLFNGSYETMLGILGHTLQESFPWQECPSQYCAYEHGPELGRKLVTGNPLGFDASESDIELTASTWGGKNLRAFEAMRAKAKHIKNGRYVILQVSSLYVGTAWKLWSQMVKMDSTFGVLYSGNYEILLYRDRRNQAVYISDIIEPHSIGKGISGGPGYYQIHIGLYITAIRDAIRRASHLREVPITWTRAYDCGFGRFQPANALAFAVIP
ncbi:hypothetical protein AX15_004438 [Amanita polypyramis BW_CC]|nr:hypothetical protein AX15_004438 [Amanita polypyramis BW_CC]